MHRVQYLSAVQIKPWWQWHCFQWYEYWLKKCIWWQLKLFVLINIFIDYHVSYQIHFSGMNTLKKKKGYRQPATNVMMGRGHVAPPAPVLVTCFLLRDHSGMNLAINASQLMPKGCCLLFPSASAICTKTILCISVCKWNKRQHLDNISDSRHALINELEIQ